MTLRSIWVLTGSNSRHNHVAYFGRSNSHFAIPPLMAEWRNGGMAEWQNGVMEEWGNGGMVIELRNGGIVIEWRNGGMAEFGNGGMAEWE